MNFDFATSYVANTIMTNFTDIMTAFQNSDEGLTTNQEMLVAGAVRTHNAGRAGTVAKPNLGNGLVGEPVLGNLLKEAIKKNDMSILDRGTAGGNNDYVTDVMAIWENCF
jgi:hypothetical protein